MSEIDLKIVELELRLDTLVRTQIDFQKEILQIRNDLARLRLQAGSTRQPQPIPPTESPIDPVRPPDYQRPRPEPRPPIEPSRPVQPPTFGMSGGADEPRLSETSESAFSHYVSSSAENARADLEKFIGENLISKIGIVILVLGVGIGAKYAIDNNLISPLTRIIIGYAFGFGLVGLAIKLKPKYHNFSSVLISGGMAIMYFVTYFAYASYGLIPQSAAFALMAMFTVFTVVAAWLYDRQIIAHIGLVGAYAVPFLLSDDSGNYAFLFSYMSVLNAGILAISIKKSWKPLFYTASVFTWLIYLGWFATKYSPSEHFYLALIFLATFFAIFYATKIVHGVQHGEADDVENTVSTMATCIIFFGFCLAIGTLNTSLEKYWAFFTYLAVISCGILLTSFRFYGRFILYLNFGFTWLIFGAWYLDQYHAPEHFALAAIFAAVFFAIFYVTILSHRLISDSFSFIENAGLILTNSFLFYGFGYSILSSHEILNGYLGPFTAAHAALHFGVAQLVNRIRSSAVDVIQVLTILILTFATISIPVQFDGNYVTLIWSVEACLLFWFGRVKQVRLFEYFSFPIMVLATGSLFLDWVTLYADRTTYISEFNRQPIANGDFITALVFIAAFVFIFATNRDERFEPAIDPELVRPLGFALVAVAILVLYNTFRLEISNYYHLQSVALRSSEQAIPSRSLADLGRFNVVWQINYSIAFLIAMCAANIRRFRSVSLAYLNTAFGLIGLFIFATVGMVLFHELRQSQGMNDAGVTLSMNIAIRHISYLFAGGLLYSLFLYSRDELLSETVPEQSLRFGFDVVLYSFILIAASGELVNLMGQFHIPDAYKLGLSVLWGAYALVLIILGIAWNKKHLRIGAIVLLAVTLVKLFLYDVADLDTIPKTILFVTLGITLLLVSFLYNKYKAVIFVVNADNEE